MIDKNNRKKYAIAQFNLGLACYKKGDLAKAIEYWNTIKRGYGNKVYTQAQFNLGLAYQEQGKIEKAIEHWNNIKEEDDKEKYAQAQFNLGLAYQEQGKIEKAIEHWNNIKREDDKAEYAKAQFNLGNIYCGQEKIEKTIEHWSNIKREDDKETYDVAQFYLGVTYSNQDSSVKAIASWKNIQKEDNKESYTKAQLNLGVVYSKQGDLAKAVEHLSNVERVNDKGDYAKAQLYLGELYNEQDDLVKAIEHWINVKKEDDKEAYANVQLSLAEVYEKKNDIDNALRCLSDVREDDDKEAYVRAQFNLGIYYQKTDAKKAIDIWKNIKEEYDKEVYAQAQLVLGTTYYFNDELDEAEKYVKRVLLQKDTNFLKAYFLKASIISETIAMLRTYRNNKWLNYEDLKQGLNAIIVDVDTILQSLLIRFEQDGAERKVATYTQVEIARKFIHNETESFWLNIANTMNDKTEGKKIFEFIGYKEDKEATDNICGFLTCFTFNHNSLNQFRLYGKTDGKEGSGVSFVVSTDMFSSKHSDNHINLITNNRIAEIKSDEISKNDRGIKKNLIIEPIPLYRCIYMNPENNYICLARRSRYSFFLEYNHLGADKCEEKYDKYKLQKDNDEKNVKDALKSIKSNYEQINSILSDREELKQKIDQLIRKILLPICYLTKHAAFEEEAECRIVYITDIDNEIVTFENGRFYVAYGIPIIDKQGKWDYLENIYLGPKASSTAEMELVYLYRKRGKAKRPKIEKSNLPLA